MAEAIVNLLFVDTWQASSAGTKPAGYVHPKAIRVLSEVGIQHDGNSKHVHEFFDVPFDLVVTVCDSAAEECPLWLDKGKSVHISFPDPAAATGTEEELLDVFRQVRDDITIKVPFLLRQWTIDQT